MLDILAGHSVTTRPAFGHRLGPVLVQRIGVTIHHLLQVGSDVVGVDLLCSCYFTTLYVSFFDENECVTFANDVSQRHGDGTNDAVSVGGNDVFHFHGFDDGDLLAGSNLVVDVDIE